jgi:hypothetical protein
MARGRVVQDPKAMDRAERDRAKTIPSASDSSVTGTILDLQQSAGNKAVGLALAQHGVNQPVRPGPQPAQARAAASTAAAPTSATPAPAPTVTLQLGGMWQDLVVRPLARARERLDRRPAEPEAALQDIDSALAGIGSVKNATPTEDDNHIRLEILERRVRGFRDLVASVAGKGKDDRAIERDMIAWRAEAVELGKEFNEPTGDIYPNTDPADWKVLVVDHLWHGQQAFSQGEMETAIFDYLKAAIHVLKFTKWVPGYHYFALLRLEAGVEATTRQMQSRSENNGALIEAAIGAYETADVLGKHLTGKPVADEDDEPRPDAQGAKDPDFTWERPSEPVKDDTALERP